MSLRIGSVEGSGRAVFHSARSLIRIFGLDSRGKVNVGGIFFIETIRSFCAIYSYVRSKSAKLFPFQQSIYFEPRQEISTVVVRFLEVC